MAGDMSHKQVVEAIATVAARVMMVALPVSATFNLSESEAAATLAGDVVQVLKYQNYPAVYIDQHAEWSDLMKQADERTRFIFIALVMGIYE